MDPFLKDLMEILLSLLAIVGAMVGFGFGMHQWRRGQAWQRAERLDRFIEKFETDRDLRTAAAILDWSSRDFVSLEGQPWGFTNEEALLALRDHREIVARPMFPGSQARIRDAYDALLAFLDRLETAVDTRLIDAEPARRYFRYWLERLLTFDRHRDDHSVLGIQSPRRAVRRYIEVYGDADAVASLARRFGLENEWEATQVEPSRGSPRTCPKS